MNLKLCSLLPKAYNFLQHKIVSKDSLYKRFLTNNMSSTRKLCVQAFDHRHVHQRSRLTTWETSGKLSFVY